MPEYFLEMNSRHNIRSPRKAVSDVKEVWFPGSHSDVYVVPQSTETIYLMYSHPVVGLPGQGRHQTRCTHTLETAIPYFTLLMPATYHFYG